jgi:hypothetical protein
LAKGWKSQYKNKLFYGPAREICTQKNPNKINNPHGKSLMSMFHHAGYPFLLCEGEYLWRHIKVAEEDSQYMEIFSTI